jgi:hypothetical protein
MKAAAKRKMEFEKLQERKIQTEREKEGDLWSDKEVFVTSAYRKKMEGKSFKIPIAALHGQFGCLANFNMGLLKY